MRLKTDIIIAIDGPSSSGKSSLAKKIAEMLNYTYIDTGAMYRAVTFYAIENNLTSENNVDSQKLVNSLNKIDIHFTYDNQRGKSLVYLNGREIENEIRTLAVSQFVSPVAAISEVRKHLVNLQQKMGENKRIAMDGRDIGTVVFKDAEIKIFLTATAEVRAQRRYKELITKGEKVSFDEILQNIQQRDLIDSTRDTTPLRPAVDAINIDNSNINEHETFSVIATLIAERYGYGVHFI
jgi:cytidylate kinase